MRIQHWHVALTWALLVLATAGLPGGVAADTASIHKAVPAAQEAQAPRGCRPEGTVVSTGNTCAGRARDLRVLALCCSRLAMLVCEDAGNDGVLVCVDEAEPHFQ